MAEMESLQGEGSMSSNTRLCGCLYSLDWTTGLDYWTGLLGLTFFATKNHFYALQLPVDLQTMFILACKTWPLTAQYPFDNR